jgi:hypothetical protein
VCGGIFSMLLTQLYLINPHIEQNALLVKGLVRDIHDVEHSLLMSYTTQNNNVYSVNSNEVLKCIGKYDQMIANQNIPNYTYSAKKARVIVDSEFKASN